jgi:hypothetical protein
MVYKAIHPIYFALKGKCSMFRFGGLENMSRDCIFPFKDFQK